ncbi:hypothetical protein B0H14DRAFT_3543965 [Mycena olivaceomarginata]|nr:hypothetical protein B0H14DRAFT_3515639 [Mycena olivaceomarginata]KAJ7798822.1 hypothetical protein B0H14DRAFT_3543965 [Mycena olivaceomarginata]
MRCRYNVRPRHSISSAILLRRDCDPQFFCTLFVSVCSTDAPPQSSCPASPPPSRSPYLHPTQLHRRPIRLPALPLPPHAHHSYPTPRPRTRTCTHIPRRRGNNIPRPAPETFLTNAHLASFRKDDTFVCAGRRTLPLPLAFHTPYACRRLPGSTARYAPAPTPTPTYTSMLSPQTPPGCRPSSGACHLRLYLSRCARRRRLVGSRGRGKEKESFEGIVLVLALALLRLLALRCIDNADAVSDPGAFATARFRGRDAPEEEDEDAWWSGDEDDSEGEGDGK